LPNQAAHTGLPEGNYQATVTDANGCTGTAEAIIPSDAGFDITINTENATCQDNNGRAVVSINGPTQNYTYRWNDIGNQTTSAAIVYSQQMLLPVWAYPLLLAQL